MPRKISEAEDPAIRQMMANATRCLGGCGVVLQHHQTKEGRRNRGYCSLTCFYTKTPKMAYAEMVYSKPIREVVVETLNARTVESSARHLGIEKATIYQWIRKLKIRQVSRWEASAHG